MPDQIYIGNFAKGLKTDRLPFNIDNDAFPTLFNFYSWRGRARRKRGTVALGRLQANLISVDETSQPYQLPSQTLSGGAGNLINGFPLVFPPTSSVVPGSLSLVVGSNTYTEPSPPDGTLVGSPSGTGTINYATGAVTFEGATTEALTGEFSLYFGLPVMGLLDVVLATSSSDFPSLLAFDTISSYQFNQTTNQFYEVNFYKESEAPFLWSGTDFQLFWGTNYEGAFWATNNKPGFHFEVISTIIVGTLTTITTATPHMLSTGMWVFFSEITGIDAEALNMQTFQITVTGDTSFTVVEDTTPLTIDNSGIFQVLNGNSNASPSSQGDGIRWYDGDPTGGTGIPSGTGKGWVNFAPPLSNGLFDIDNLPAEQYYLVGALAIVPFKDRLIFFSPYIQTSTGSPIQLQDVALWSWNATPYYTALVPTGQTFDPRAYYVNLTGQAGYISAGISQPIATVSNNEDALLVGFGGRGRKTRFVSTGNDFSPFLFFNINSELPSTSTFSSVALDRGAIDMGTYGICMTDQQSSQRIDLDIPDEIFRVKALNSGKLRVNAIRDFQREWIYFSYPVNNSEWRFPTRTFLFNYRDNTWAILYENFTAHGNFRRSTNYTWATLPFKTWNDWREPWNSGSTSAEIPNIIAGNPQGFVLIIAQGTGEAPSGNILGLIFSGGNTLIASIDHCVQVGDYLLMQGSVGLLESTITDITYGNPTVITTTNTFAVNDLVTINNVVGTTELNGNTYRVVAASGSSISLDVDSSDFTTYDSGGIVTSAFNGLIGKVITVIDAFGFIVDLQFPRFTSTYLGLGTFTRLSVPLLQTKQFPFYWDQGRQVRLSVQKYLMDRTVEGQVTLQISLSQDPDNPRNSGSIVPTEFPDPTNNALVYSDILFTCPEPNNLQTPTASSQFQIWHRVNTSLIGDTFQIGITLNDAQMRDLTLATSEITLHGIQLTVDRGPLLS